MTAAVRATRPRPLLDDRRLRSLYRSAVGVLLATLAFTCLLTVKVVVLEVTDSATGFDVRFDVDSGESRSFGVDTVPDGVASGDDVRVRYAESAWIPPQLIGTPWWDAWPFLAFSVVPLFAAVTWRLGLQGRAADAG